MNVELTLLRGDNQPLHPIYRRRSPAIRTGSPGSNEKRSSVPFKQLVEMAALHTSAEPQPPQQKAPSR